MQIPLAQHQQDVDVDGDAPEVPVDPIVWNRRISCQRIVKAAKQSTTSRNLISRIPQGKVAKEVGPIAISRPGRKHCQCWSLPISKITVATRVEDPAVAVGQEVEDSPKCSDALKEQLVAFSHRDWL
jgi:hypothetical protein